MKNSCCFFFHWYK